MKKFLIVSVVALAAVSVAVTAAIAKPAKKSATTEVCVLLPDTKSSVRWEQFDKPGFAKSLKAAGVTYSITNALNDPLKQIAQADQCLSNGAKVAVITSISTGTSIAIQKKFAAAGGSSIDYDRQVVGGIAKVYVSFDGNLVGRQQAKSLVSGLKASGKTKPVVAQLWGGPTDQNAYWFQSGNNDILNPLFKAGVLTRGPQKFVPLWSATTGQTIFEQMLLKTNNKIDGVLAANDGLAGAVIASLKAKGLPYVPLSGQDATVQGVQNIIAGWQTSTIYKYVPLETNAAAAAAVALLKGQKPKSNSTRPNGKHPEPTLVLPVVTINRSNFRRLFTDKWIKRSDVCIGEFAKYCVTPAPAPKG